MKECNKVSGAELWHQRLRHAIHERICDAVTNDKVRGVQERQWKTKGQIIHSLEKFLESFLSGFTVLEIERVVQLRLIEND